MNKYSKFGILSAFVLLSWGFAAFSKVPDSLSVVAFAVPVFLFSLAVATLSIVSIAPVEAYLAVPAIVIASGAFPPFMGFSTGSAFVSLGYFLGALLFFFEVRQDRTERVKVVIGKHVDSGISAFFTFVFIGFSLYTFFLLSEEGSKPEDMIPEGIYGFASTVTGQYFSQMGCDVNSTLDACVEKIAQKEIARNLEQSSQQCDTVLPEYKSGCLAQIRAALDEQLPGYKIQVRDSIISQFDSTSKGTDSLASILKKGLKTKAGEMLSPVAKYVPLIGALFAYSTLNILSLPASILSKVFSGALFSVLLSLKAIEKKTVEVEAEILE